jgi:hypothetical protein
MLNDKIEIKNQSYKRIENKKIAFMRMRTKYEIKK